MHLFFVVAYAPASCAKDVELKRIPGGRGRTDSKERVPVPTDGCQRAN